MVKHKILVVDDEDALCEILQYNLKAEGYDADTASSAEEALKLRLTDYSLIILDVMMGEISGFRMAEILKADPSTANIPIIFCTAKDSDDDAVTGLGIGADDYIAKPFSVRQVIARIKSVLRRAAPQQSGDESIISHQTLSMDLKRKICSVDASEVKLTKTEFEILALLLQNRSIIFSRADILERVWSDEVIVLDRTIDVNITRLRRKIGRYGEHIVTRLGYGYGFEE